MTGPIPATWRNLGNLAELRLWDNALTGSVPGWFGTLTDLRVLILRDNPLTGRIPSELASLANLSELDLGFTVLSGPVPAAMTRLSGLERFDIEGTGVCVPDDAALQAWLAAIPEFVSSGLSCGTSVAPVTVAFEPADYRVTEGDSAYVRLRLSAAPTPARAVSIAVTATAGRGATAADYRVPGTVTFRRNATEAAIEVAALRDRSADDGETVTLGFGALAPRRDHGRARHGHGDAPRRSQAFQPTPASPPERPLSAESMWPRSGNWSTCCARAAVCPARTGRTGPSFPDRRPSGRSI